MSFLLRFYFASIATLACLIPGSASAAELPASLMGKACASQQNGKWVEVRINPSLLNLLTNPQNYDGCEVIASGFLAYRWPQSNLYFTRDDRLVNGTSFGVIRVSLHGAKMAVDRDDVKSADGNYVTVEGRFRVQGTLFVIEELTYMKLRSGEHLLK